MREAEYFQHVRTIAFAVGYPGYAPSTFADMVETRQIAPTVPKTLGLDPSLLTAVQSEHTETLPGLPLETIAPPCAEALQFLMEQYRPFAFSM